MDVHGQAQSQFESHQKQPLGPHPGSIKVSPASTCPIDRPTADAPTSPSLQDEGVSGPAQQSEAEGVDKEHSQSANDTREFSPAQQSESSTSKGFQQAGKDALYVSGASPSVQARPTSPEPDGNLSSKAVNVPLQQLPAQNRGTAADAQEPQVS